jgi:hypothetical protein
MAEVKRWCGDPPTACDLCGRKITDVFVDGKTLRGPWGNLCLLCHCQYGIGLGTGRGQKYERQPDGSWQKVGG